MKREAWKRRIVEATREAGTYQPFFEPVIDTLAGILEKRDESERLYNASGASPIVKHTNKGGATNLEQNPALRLINDLNRDALQYWRELGLTPSGLSKISSDVVKKTEKKERPQIEELRSRFKVG